MEDRKFTRWLLVSDLDETLTGDDEGLAEFFGSSSEILVVLNSSRPRESVLRTLAAVATPILFEGMITALGTEISLAGEIQRDWSAQFEGWQRKVVDAYMAETGVEPHHEEMQTPWKASFAVARSRWREAREAVLALLPESQVIVSGESDFDVIPAAAGKDKATLWVANRLGIAISRLVVAGDSGNDLAMFQVAPKAIAVANARAELIEGADPARTFFANLPRARGVLEGLRHWGAIPST